MQQDLVEKIKNLPEYHSLVKERGRLACSLSAAMLAAYFGFILLVAFNPEFFSTIVWGRYTTIGFPLGVGLIILAFVLTGMYVRKANQRFDVLTEKIKEAVK
jgi:uncharacterized membrane protein (DUF485 family)